MTSTFPKKYNLKYMDQLSYLEGYHRSGWPFVMRQLFKLHSDTATVRLDCYVDRTFHWLKPAFLPYDSPWVGIVHHTFDETFSSFNCVQLLKNPAFLASLSQCIGLMVFSDNLADRWVYELHGLGYNIPVQAIVHPTEFVTTLWTPDQFTANASKKLVQVGAWLRDNYAMYRLNGTHKRLQISEEETLRKAVLKGPHMDHYFRPVDFFRLMRPPEWKLQDGTRPPLVSRVARNRGPLKSTIQDTLSPNAEIDVGTVLEPTTSTDTICRDIICRDSDYLLNKYVVGAINLLEEHDSSVVVIPTLDDAAFDELLSSNVVFVKLVDAAAVNTLIECIVRNTPIVISALPAIVQVLGVEYPLYLPSDNLDDVPGWLTTERIMEAHLYLSSMDKSSLEATHFIDSIVNGEIYTAIGI